MNGQSRNLHATIDKVGVWASSLCSLHCALMPLLLILLPFGSIAWLADENNELVFIFISCSLATASICWGFLKHRNNTVFFLLSLGVLTIVVAHHYHESHVGSFLMSVGGVQLAVSHYLNIKLCNSCSTCKH